MEIVKKRQHRSRDEVVSLFNETYSRHGGRVDQAAAILGMSPSSLDRALFRAKKDGVEVTFISYTRPGKNKKRPDMALVAGGVEPAAESYEETVPVRSSVLYGAGEAS